VVNTDEGHRDLLNSLIGSGWFGLIVKQQQVRLAGCITADDQPRAVLAQAGGTEP
jgi:hypothetical protein